MDAVYMTATQAMTGQGGWPMTVFATPGRRAVLLRHLLPARRTSCGCSQSVDQGLAGPARGGARSRAPRWSRRSAGRRPSARPDSPLTAELLDAAAAQLRQGVRPSNGGFGGAPKFPPHMDLLFLLRHHQRTGDGAGAGDRPAHLRGDGPRRHLRPARRRLRPLLGGRALDRAALREDALRQRAAAAGLHPAVAAHRRSAGRAGSPPRRPPFLVDDLAPPEGGLRLRAGRRHRRRRGADVRLDPGAARRGARRGRRRVAPPTCSASPQAGTFEHGTSVLRLARDVDDADAEVARALARVRARLREARDARPQPARDDKVVAAWNGLAITALAEFRAAVTGDPVTAAAARRRRRASCLGRDLHLVDGRLRRVSRDGVVGEPAGVLEDYGCVAEAFCALHQLTGEGRWLDAGRRAARHRAGPLRRDGRAASTTPPTTPSGWSARPADPTDNATPSGLSAIVGGAGGVLGADRRAALPGGGRAGAGDRRADRRPARPVHRVRRRRRRGAALRPVRDRGRHRGPGRATRCCRPPAGTPRPVR